MSFTGIRQLSPWRTVVSIALLALLFVGCASLLPSAKRDTRHLPVAALLDLQLVAPLEAAGATVSIAVTQMDGTPLYLHDPDRLLIPASVQKLFVAADALVHLGADFHFDTHFYTNSLLTSDGLLEGDIIADGCWDPSLSGDHPVSGWPWASFDRFAQTLADQGVREIGGGILARGRIFIPDGWEVSDLMEGYAPAIAEFCWNDGLVTSYAGDVAGSLFWRIWPDPVYWSGDHHEARLFPPPDTKQGPATPPENHPLWPGMNRLRMTPAPDPRLLAADALRSALEEAGITVAGQCRVLPEDSSETGELSLLYTHTSPPMHRLLRNMLVYSSNPWAEMIQASVAVQVGEDPLGPPHWPAALDSLGIDRRELRASDASGLSRKNNLSPNTIQELLFRSYATWGEEWLDLMPRANEPRSTLAGRMAGYETEIAVKTGSLSRCRSLAGYILRDGAPHLVFTIILNNAPFDPNPLLDDCLIELAEWAKHESRQEAGH